MAQRKRWLDVVKGIGIILVIIGHCKRPDIILKYIQAFHMPLFFIVAGYLFSKKSSFPGLIKRKSKALLKPYLIYGVLNLVIWMIYLAVKKGVNDELFKTGFRYVIGLVYSRGTWYWMPNCSPIWFLTAMFISVILFNYIVKFKDLYQYILTALSFLAACVICYTGLFKLPWNVDTALWALLYMLVGYKLKQIDFQSAVTSRKALWSVISFAMLVVGSFAALLNDIEFVSMDSIEMGNVLLMLLSTLLIPISLIIFVILFIPENRVLEIYGRNTVIILGTNYLVNKTVYILWDLFLPSFKTDYSWIIQCVIQVAVLGVLAFFADIYKKRKSVIKTGQEIKT